MKRILITGSREWQDEALLRDALDTAWGALGGDPETVVVSGGAWGADEMCQTWAAIHGLQVERHPAEWSKHGKRAGFVRNAEMVALGADLCVAFIYGGSNGATMTANLAEKAGIPTWRYER
jgi:hypothetical protein